MCSFSDKITSATQHKGQTLGIRSRLAIDKGLAIADND